MIEFLRMRQREKEAAIEEAKKNADLNKNLDHDE